MRSEQLYHITSGQYQRIGGIFGEIRVPLPNPTQSYLLLATDPATQTAELRVLDLLRQPSLDAWTNGHAAGSTISFDYQIEGLVPGIPSRVTGQVALENHHLRFQAMTRTVEPVCCDFEHTIIHTNVVAEACSEILFERKPSTEGPLELRWNGGAGICLQTAPRWGATDWADVPGTEGTNRVTLLVAGEAAFFRLLQR